MRYFVTDSNGIPLHSQPDEGYTLTEACARHSREVQEAYRLLHKRFPEVPYSEFDKNYGIVTADLKEVIL